jgi:hypothetical protein
MDNLRTFSRQFDTTVGRYLAPIDNNVYVASALSLFVVLYACSMAPVLHPTLARFFQNPLVKIVFFFLAAYAFNRNPSAAAVAAVGLVVALYILSMVLSSIPSFPGLPRMSIPTVDSVPVDDDGILIEQEGSAGEVPMEHLTMLDKDCMSSKSFFPQYANMTYDSYIARDNINNVGGYDPTSAYASI